MLCWPSFDGPVDWSVISSAEIGNKCGRLGCWGGAGELQRWVVGSVAGAGAGAQTLSPATKLREAPHTGAGVCRQVDPSGGTRGQGERTVLRIYTNKTTTLMIVFLAKRGTFINSSLVMISMRERQFYVSCLLTNERPELSCGGRELRDSASIPPLQLTINGGYGWCRICSLMLFISSLLIVRCLIGTTPCCQYRCVWAEIIGVTTKRAPKRETPKCNWLQVLRRKEALQLNRFQLNTRDMWHTECNTRSEDFCRSQNVMTA